MLDNPYMLSASPAFTRMIRDLAIIKQLNMDQNDCFKGNVRSSQEMQHKQEK